MAIVEMNDMGMNDRPIAVRNDCRSPIRRTRMRVWSAIDVSRPLVASAKSPSLGQTLREWTVAVRSDCLDKNA